MKYIRSSVLLLGGLCFAQAGFALPLLSENAAQNVANVLTLYPDSDNPSLFYFMPNSSTFAHEQSGGLPEFGFTYWGLDSAASNAGAYMVFSMRLHSDDAQTAALNAALAAGKQIAVLPVQESMVGLNTTAAGAPLSPLFEEFNFATKAGRAEDEIAVNSIMTPLGAKVFRAAISNPALMKFDYCYKVQGLGPNFKAHITVDMNRVYSDFQAHASYGNWFWRGDIDTEVENLRQQNIVKIDIQGGDAKEEEYVKSVADSIVAKIFVPELAAKPTASGGSGLDWGFSRVQLSYTYRNEDKNEEWELTRRDLVMHEFCVPLVLDEINQYKDKLVQDADKPQGE